MCPLRRRGLTLMALLLAATLAALAQHPHERGMPRLTVPGYGLRHLTRLPPAEREQTLRQNPDFQRLSPQQQRNLMKGLKHLNAMPPQKQQKVIQHLRAFARLSARQRAGLRQIYEQYSKMPSTDQAAFRKAYKALRPLPPAVRQQHLAQPQLQQSLTPGEMSTLRHALALDLPADLVGARE